MQGMKKILHVEDCLDTIEAVKDYFETYHKGLYQIDSVRSAKDAISKISENKYHLILFDIHLPNEENDDIFLNREISALKNDKDIPLIVLSGLHKSIKSVTELDYDEWLTKPIELSKLKIIIDAYISKG